MGKKFEKILNSAVFSFVVISGINLVDLLFLSANAYRNKKSIDNLNCYESFEECMHDFTLEKTKLGLENISIGLKFDNNLADTPAQVKRDKNNYIITIHPDKMSRFVLRHELYHVYRFDQGYDLSTPIKRGYEEWIATSYGMSKD